MDVSEEMNIEAIALELRKVKDELEIRNLVANIYLLTDHERDLDVYGENFTPDAVWERVDGRGSGFHLGTRLEGRDRILADRRTTRAQRLTGPDSLRRHLITTLAVDVSGDRTAEARSKFFVIMADEPRPFVIAVGSYHDTLRHTEAGWKVAHRRYESHALGA